MYPVKVFSSSILDMGMLLKLGLVGMSGVGIYFEMMLEESVNKI